MKKLGKFIIMGEAEYVELSAAVRISDKKLQSEMQAAFYAGKFHAAGGYSHTLPKLKEELRQAKEQISRYKPIGEIFQPSEALTALLEDVCGVSDVDAAADFEVVKNQARLAKAKL